MSFNKLTSKSVTIGFAATLSLAILLPTSANASVIAPSQITVNTLTSSINPSTITQIASAVKKVTTHKTTANVHMRTAAGIKNSSIRVIPKDSTISKTGKTSGVWHQVKFGGKTGWTHSTYIKTTVKTTKTTPAPKATPKTSSVGVKDYKATANVNMRKGAGTSNSIILTVPKTKLVKTTGKTSGSWYEAKYLGKTGWINKNYLALVKSTPIPKPIPAPAKPAPTSPNDNGSVTPQTSVNPKPIANTVNYITTNNLNLRSAAGTQHSVVIVLTQGVGVVKTGKVSGSWWQIKSGSYTGWVSSSYLKAGKAPEMVKPTVVALHENIVNVINKVKASYSEDITAIYGIRAGSVGHSAGLAADVMIKNYKTKTGVAAGDKISKYLTTNHESLKIDYLIWQDKIWLGSKTGWVEYSKSGKYGTQFSNNWNDTTRHMDHIHVEVKR